MTPFEPLKLIAPDLGYDDLSYFYIHSFTL